VANTVITIGSPAHIVITLSDFATKANGVSSYVPQYIAVVTQQPIQTSYFSTLSKAITENPTVGQNSMI
jgi:hypothetical protein